jgi:hypothetical protein
MIKVPLFVNGEGMSRGEVHFEHGGWRACRAILVR